MNNVMVCIVSNHDDLVRAVVYCGSANMGNFGLRIGKIIVCANELNVLLNDLVKFLALVQKIA